MTSVAPASAAARASSTRYTSALSTNSVWLGAVTVMPGTTDASRAGQPPARWLSRRRSLLRDLQHAWTQPSRDAATARPRSVAAGDSARSSAETARWRSPAMSSSPSANGVSPRRPNCSRSLDTSRAWARAGDSGTSPRTVTCSPSALDDDLERCAGGAEQPHVQPRAPRAHRRRQLGEARARALEQRGVRRPQHGPAGGHGGSASRSPDAFAAACSRTVRTADTAKPNVGAFVPSGASKPRPSPTSMGVVTSTRSSPPSRPTTSPITTP